MSATCQALVSYLSEACQLLLSYAPVTLGWNRGRGAQEGDVFLRQRFDVAVLKPRTSDGVGVEDGDWQAAWRDGMRGCGGMQEVSGGEWTADGKWAGRAGGARGGGAKGCT